MNLKQFKYILTLNAEGSFSRAAESLGISQPSLSQYVKNIEKELGIELFLRTGSEVRITDAGKRYIEAGRKILDLEHQMLGQLDDLKANKTGTVIVGVSPHRSVCLMPGVIRRFKEIYPGIQVVIEERVGHELLFGAEHGEFDLCITTGPVNEKLFACEPCFREELVLAVPAQLSADWDAKPCKNRDFPAIDIHYIEGLPVITLAQSQLMQQKLEQLLETYGITVQAAVQCRSIEAQLAMVRAGLGLALVPSGIERFSPPDEHVRYFSIRQETETRQVVVVYRKGQYLSQPVRDFKEILISTKEGGAQ